MTIVVLDGYTLNPGDLSWDGVAQYGDLTVYDRTPADLILERSEGAEILLTNKTPLSAETISGLPDLRYIGVLATGYNVVDIQAAGERGIVVTNVPTYGTNSVAQMVFALLLELSRHVGLHSDSVRSGEWVRSADFCYWKTPQIELDGKTMGIVGFGRIGKQVARIASVMGMKIIASDEVKSDVPAGVDDFRWVEVEELLRESDVVSLHAPLTPRTQGLINRDTIALMKPSAFLLNTARGPLIVDADLAEALNTGRLAGAGLDVLTVEPPKADNPLLSAKNCIVTPHIAWATFEARSRLMNTVAENIGAFLSGKRINVVS